MYGRVYLFCVPCSLSVFALERLLGKKLCLRNFLFVFVTNSIIVNIIGMFLIYVFSGSATMPISIANGIKLSYSLSYLLITALCACGVVLAERFYFYRLRIAVSEPKKDKSEGTNDSTDKR